MLSPTVDPLPSPRVSLPCPYCVTGIPPHLTRSSIEPPASIQSNTADYSVQTLHCLHPPMVRRGRKNNESRRLSGPRRALRHGRRLPIQIARPILVLLTCRSTDKTTPQLAVGLVVVVNSNVSVTVLDEERNRVYLLRWHGHRRHPSGSKKQKSIKCGANSAKTESINIPRFLLVL